MIVEEPEDNEERDSMLGIVEARGGLKEKLTPFELEESHQQRLHTEGKVRRPGKSFAHFDQARKRTTIFFIIICTIALGFLIFYSIFSKRHRPQNQQLQIPVSDYKNVTQYKKRFLNFNDSHSFSKQKKNLDNFPLTVRSIFQSFSIRPEVFIQFYACVKFF